MNNPSWKIFRPNSNPEDVFEKDVAKRLFCTKIGVHPDQISCPDGYEGIENVPVETSKGWVAFQAKHSMEGKQNAARFCSTEKVIKPVVNGDYRLDKIYCYSSGNAPQNGKTKAQRKIETTLEKHGISIEWIFQDQIIETLRDTSDKLLKRASRCFFEYHPQPKLTQPKPINNPEGLSLLRFSERALKFEGRETELTELKQFVDRDDAFSWWLLIGSAFTGKSRLTLEFCLYLSDGWDWGWVASNAIQEFDFSSWQPKKTHF